MKSLVLKKYGDIENFEVRDVPIPSIRPGHVLIKVAASSVNPVDVKIRQGLLPIGPDLPATLHGDMSGGIIDIGAGVTEFKKGDEVYGCVGGFKELPGVLAEFIIADSQLIALKPKNLSMEEAAVLPLVSITAWNGIVDRAKVQKGQRVLVHGATGGVGHIALQLAKAYDAEVHTTCSSEEKSDIAKKLGADVAINYKNLKVNDYVSSYTGGEGYDVVFDTVGGSCLDDSFLAAKIDGVVVSIAARASHDLSQVHIKSLTLHVVFMLLPLIRDQGRNRHGEILKELSILVENSQVRPLLHCKKFDFEDVGAAHKCLENGEAVGKISLVSNW